MVKKKIHLVSLVLFSLFIINSVSTAGPTTHERINTIAIEQLPSSSIKEIIVNNRNCFEAGFVGTDVTVFYYFSTGLRSRYEATHSMAFCDELMRLAETDCQRAVAYGCVAHNIQDSVFHNIFVYERIKKYYLPNNPFHPIFELKPEAHIIKTYPEEYTRLQHALNPLLNDPVLMAKFSSAVTKLRVGDYEVPDIEGDVRRFNDVIGNPEGFYARAFALPNIYKSFAYGNRTYGSIIFLIGIGLLALGLKFKKKFFLILPILITILGAFFLIGGIVGITSNVGFDRYIQLSVDRTIEVFQPAGWNNRYKYDPTGFAKLNSADSQIMWVWFLIIGGLIFIGGLYLYLKLKRRRR